MEQTKGSPTTSGDRRRSKPSGRQRCGSTVSMRIPIVAADALLLERIEPPSEVDLFGQFEELCKAYAIEPPYAARSQIELMFDVYDGRKLNQAAQDDLDEDEGDDLNEDEGLPQRDTGQTPAAKRSRMRAKGFSWCKLVSLVNKKPRRSPNAIRCCLAGSDTQTELCALSLDSGAVNRTGSRANSTNELVSAALSPNLDDDQEDAELKAEALRLIQPLASQLRRSSTLSEAAYSARIEQQAGNGAGSGQLNQEPMQHQQIILDGADFGQHHVSVCLFDKRCRNIQLKHEAENGRHWSRLYGQVEELRGKLTGAFINQADRCAFDRLAERLNMIQREAKRKRPVAARNERIGANKDNTNHLERLVGLTKNSLNHLIDAQLLLRNKLSSEQQQQQQAQQTGNAAANNPNKQLTGQLEYEHLLKNNFNLLKIWQNLEETKRLACFVCEPIKANLGDLFWFSRQRAAVRVSLCSSGANKAGCILSSPLVCMDALEVKRGLIQILEALNYLHAICKLIHRNLTPRNILIAANDNWKLSGLEFAIRSESASMMAQEDGGSLLGYSSGATTQAALRRQRTLHYTKCDEFVKRPKSGLAQPELDYLAPEIWKSAKCSHKSDMFSFGLILGQTYDLSRHKSAINCRGNVDNYESESKKLIERRKKKLARLVPFEMRAVLVETLHNEPHLRPSANYALQLFRRLIDLCKANEDSLRHLRRSLNHLDTCWPTGARNINNNLTDANATHKKPRSYFRKVTCSMEEQSPQRKQTKNLHLLNLLLRGIDSLAISNSHCVVNNNSSNNNLSNNNLSSSDEQIGQQQHFQQTFNALKHQFEQTFETLRQLYKSPSTGKLVPLLAVNCQDSRYLMLVVAIHRRLLEQVSRMRAELPPVCRLTAANTQANRPTRNHKALAEIEDRLRCMLARQSLVRLAPLLTDPLLKLDEFLLLYELVNDLLAFVGQKCRQSFILRGRQLLNELTPVTGCPSLSSTDDEDTLSGQVAESGRLAGSGYLAGGIGQLAGSRDTLNNISGFNPVANRMSSGRHSFAAGVDDQEDQFSIVSARQQPQQSRYLNQHSNMLPATKISITAPSPMGSTRDVSGLHSDHQAHRRQYQGASSEMIERMGGLSLSSAGGYDTSDLEDDLTAASGRSSLAGVDDGQGNLEKREDKERSRSQLIDELLKTINDDSFNDLVDFNNKFAAQTSGGHAHLNDSTRPKSAMDSVQATYNSAGGSSAYNQHGRSTGKQQQTTSGISNSRPSSSALSANQAGQQRAASPNAQPSTFDNVIRRMSTNFVQNFSKMSNSTLGNFETHDSSALRREKSSQQANSLYVDNQVPARRHSDNTINIPRIQVALSSPSAGSRAGGLNQRASVSASKLANKWKLSAKSGKRESSDKLSPNLSGALGYMRRHSSGNTTGGGNDRNQSNGQTAHLLPNASPFKTKSSSNLGIDFLLSNRSMKRRYSAASMLGHQTQRKAEDLIDAGMKSVQNMFN